MSELAPAEVHNLGEESSGARILISSMPRCMGETGCLATWIRARPCRGAWSRRDEFGNSDPATSEGGRSLEARTFLGNSQRQLKTSEGHNSLVLARFWANGVWLEILGSLVSEEGGLGSKGGLYRRMKTA